MKLDKCRNDIKEGHASSITVTKTTGSLIGKNQVKDKPGTEKPEGDDGIKVEKKVKSHVERAGTG